MDCFSDDLGKRLAAMRFLSKAGKLNTRIVSGKRRLFSP